MGVTNHLQVLGWSSKYGISKQIKQVYHLWIWGTDTNKWVYLLSWSYYITGGDVFFLEFFLSLKKRTSSKGKESSKQHFFCCIFPTGKIIKTPLVSCWTLFPCNKKRRKNELFEVIHVTIRKCSNLRKDVLLLLQWLGIAWASFFVVFFWFYFDGAFNFHKKHHKKKQKPNEDQTVALSISITHFGDFFGDIRYSWNSFYLIQILPIGFIDQYIDYVDIRSSGQATCPQKQGLNKASLRETNGW